MLISIEDVDKREYYELESVNNNWTARETELQIPQQHGEDGYQSLVPPLVVVLQKVVVLQQHSCDGN